MSQEGRRVWERLAPAGPIWTVREVSSRASSLERGGSGAGETKSEKEGPVLRRSLKALAGRGCEEVVVGGGRSEMVVAKRRFWGMRGWRDSEKRVEARRRAEGRVGAMMGDESDKEDGIVSTVLSS